MNLYVAPTYINLEKPTFWKPNNPKFEESKQPGQAQQDGGEVPLPSEEDENNKPDNLLSSSFNEMEDKEHINALRKVLSFSSVNLKFVFLEEDAYYH